MVLELLHSQPGPAGVDAAVGEANPLYPLHWCFGNIVITAQPQDSLL